MDCKELSTDVIMGLTALISGIWMFLNVKNILAQTSNYWKKRGHIASAKIYNSIFMRAIYYVFSIFITVAGLAFIGKFIEIILKIIPN